MTDATPQAAEAVRPNRAMMERDRASASLGLVVERDDPGHAVSRCACATT